MRVVTTQLAGGERNADRVFVANDAVVVLDGATAFEPVELDPGEYAEAIGREIVRRLPGAVVADAVAGAISKIADDYNLEPGRSPSSTVGVLCMSDDEANLYVLGDSPIYYGLDNTTHVLKDDRIELCATGERTMFKSALRNGRGYTKDHYRALERLQQQQRRYRNRHDGFWIAEADPTAAQHGLTLRIPNSLLSWAVMGTDGATDLLSYQDADWALISQADHNELSTLLHQLHDWERLQDPNGRRFPRAKLHDDKTLVAIRNFH